VAERKGSTGPAEHPGTGRERMVLEAGFRGRILDISQPRTFAQGQAVVVPGSRADSVFYVEKGSVEVSYNAGETTIVVALIGADNFFGEIGFFDGESRVRDIRAAEDSVIRIFDRDQVMALQESDPLLYAQFVTLMAGSICAKFRRMLEEREPLTAYAASLATGQRTFTEARPLPPRFFQTRDWRRMNSMIEAFKAEIFDLSHRLQLENGAGIDQGLRDSCGRMLDGFNQQLQELNSWERDRETEEYTWGFVFKEIFPYFMRSRFAERAYFKPKGYAGDFQMMEMIYNNKPQGDGKLGVLVDSWCLNTIAARAVRGRRSLMAELLEELAGAGSGREGRLRIMNLACGSNRELFDFLARWGGRGAVEAVCIDVDQEALEYTDQWVNTFPHQASVRLMQDNVVKWSLGRTMHDLGRFDIIYSVGLCDYLDRRLFKALAGRCFEHLKPGGKFVVGNFGTANPNRVFMDQILHWNLIHRSTEDLRELLGGTLFGDEVELRVEKTGVNLFALATRTG